MPQFAVEFHPLAADEAQAAERWYREQNETASGRFQRELDRAIGRISEQPGVGSPYLSNTRRVFLRRFPFFVVFRAGERAAFLTEACSDADLRREVERLIAESADGSLPTAGAAVAAEELLEKAGPTPLIGCQLGPYQVKSLLGSGGMGEVYRARDPELQRDIALEILPGVTLGDPAPRARLLREGRAAASLNHPSMCTIHEIGHAEGRASIAMEPVDGRPLRELAHHRPPPLDWLERAYANHESPMARLAVVWDRHELHGQPRCQARLRRLTLPQ